MYFFAQFTAWSVPPSSLRNYITCWPITVFLSKSALKIPTRFLHPCSNHISSFRIFCEIFVLILLLVSFSNIDPLYIHKSRLKGSFITMSKKMTTFWLQNLRCLPINTVKVWPHFLTKYWSFHLLAIALPSLEFPSSLHQIIKQTCTYRSRWKFSPSYTCNLLKTPSYIIV